MILRRAARRSRPDPSDRSPGPNGARGHRRRWIVARQSADLGAHSTRLAHSTALAVLSLLALLALPACETRHRSAVLVPRDFDATSIEWASAGVLRGAGAETETDEVMSRRLADASRAPDVSSELSPADRQRLLAEPFRLAYDSAWRRDLQQRIGHRRLLVGEFDETRVDSRVEWRPIFLIWVTPPFEFAHRPGVAQPVFALRLVDLEAGRIEAEFFAMLTDEAERDGISEPLLEAALAAMGLRGARP